MNYKLLLSKAFALCFMLIVSFNSYSQSDSSAKKQPSEFDINYEMANTTTPSYEAGIAKLQSEIIDNIDLTKAEDIPDGSSVTISCRIENDGKLSEIKAIEPIGYGIDKQIINQLKNKKFTPIKQGGVATSCAVVLTLPIK